MTNDRLLLSNTALSGSETDDDAAGDDDLVAANRMSVSSDVSGRLTVKVGSGVGGDHVVVDVLENRLDSANLNSKYRDYAGLATSAVPAGPPPVISEYAKGLLSTYGRVKQQVVQHPQFGKNAVFRQIRFPLGHRVPSTEVLPPEMEAPSQRLVTYSSEAVPDCFMAALFNAVEQMNPELAEDCLSLLQQLDNPWVATMLKEVAEIFGRDEFTDLPYYQGEYLKSPLPVNLRNSQIRTRDKDRLEWVLAQEDDAFIAGGIHLVSLVDDHRSVNHVVVVCNDPDDGSRVVLDSVEPLSMALTQAALDRCCGDGRTCVGLSEVFEVRRDLNRKTRHKRVPTSAGSMRAGDVPEKLPWETEKSVVS